MAVKRDTPLKWPIKAPPPWAFPAFNSGNYAGAQTGYANYLSLWVSETAAQIKVPKCRITKIRVNVLSNTTITASTLTLRKNAADTTITGTIPAVGTGQYEFTGSIDFAEGDLMCIKIVIGDNAAKVLGIYGGTVVMEV